MDIPPPPPINRGLHPLTPHTSTRARRAPQRARARASLLQWGLGPSYLVWGRSAGLVGDLPRLVPWQARACTSTGFLVSVHGFFGPLLVKLYLYLFVGSLYVPMVDALANGLLIKTDVPSLY
jgi:hypothetical protein